MKLEVYRDEANPDVLTSAHPRARQLLSSKARSPASFRRLLGAARAETWQPNLLGRLSARSTPYALEV